MISIGIDVGKVKHCASVINGLTGEVLIRPFLFTKDEETLLLNAKLDNEMFESF